jgi:hypothetical protein
LCQDDYVRITSSNKESETYTLKQPNSLGAITAYISTWLEGHKDSGSAVIYMDKYAFQDITNNGGGLESMRNFLKTIENYIENNGKGAFIVSIDPSAYEQKYHKPLIKQIINIANESGGVKVDRTNTKF